MYTDEPDDDLVKEVKTQSSQLFIKLRTQEVVLPYKLVLWFTLFWYQGGVTKEGWEWNLHGICNMLKVVDFLHVMSNTTVLSDYSAHENIESQIISI